MQYHITYVYNIGILQYQYRYITISYYIGTYIYNNILQICRVFSFVLSFPLYGVFSFPLTLALPRNFPKHFPAPSHQAMVQIQKLAFEIFEFVPLLDEKVQEKVLENFSGGPK